MDTKQDFGLLREIDNDVLKSRLWNFTFAINQQGQHKFWDYFLP
jgi:hypothetical protein